MKIDNITLEIEDLYGTGLYRHAEELERIRKSYALDGSETYHEVDKKYKGILREIDLLVVSTNSEAYDWKKVTESHDELIRANIHNLLYRLDGVDFRLSTEKQFQRVGRFLNTRYTVLEQALYKTMKTINHKATYIAVSEYVLELIKQDFAKLENEEDSLLYKMAKEWRKKQ